MKRIHALEQVFMLSEPGVLSFTRKEEKDRLHVSGGCTTSRLNRIQELFTKNHLIESYVRDVLAPGDVITKDKDYKLDDTDFAHALFYFSVYSSYDTSDLFSYVNIFHKKNINEIEWIRHGVVEKVFSFYSNLVMTQIPVGMQYVIQKNWFDNPSDKKVIEDPKPDVSKFNNLQKLLYDNVIKIDPEFLELIRKAVIKDLPDHYFLRSADYNSFANDKEEFINNMKQALKISGSVDIYKKVGNRILVTNTVDHGYVED